MILAEQSLEHPQAEHDQGKFGSPDLSVMTDHGTFTCPPPTIASTPLSDLSRTPSMVFSSSPLPIEIKDSCVPEMSELMHRLEQLLHTQQVSVAKEVEVARLIEESLQAKRLLQQEKQAFRKQFLDMIDRLVPALDDGNSL